MTATIEAIDKSARLVMLKGEKGNVVAVQVGEQMTRFNELKVGDKVSATYTESVAVNVRQPGQAAPASSSAVANPRARPAQPPPCRTPSPSRSSASTREPVGERQTEGRLRRSMRVENPKYLEAVKAGDTVDITYTRALLLEVAPVK